jgi:hypothetical protein
MQPSIQSVGAPPERHADRIVAEMLRQLAETRARLWPEICEAFNNSSDGSPKAQRKMEERIKRAGALHTVLTPGKRGRYKLGFYHSTGWDPLTDKEIMLGDAIPERPWIAYHVNSLESKGNGKGEVELFSSPLLFVSHHALSRAAQRFGARTTEHLLTAALVIWNGTMDLMNEMGMEKSLDAPPQGWRAPIQKNDPFFVVLKRHEQRKALVAVTVLIAGDGATA